MLNGITQLANTDVINSTMVPVTPRYAINPTNYGPMPISYDSYAYQPTTPPYAGGAAGVGGPATGGSATDMANATQAAIAGANPFNVKVSPLLVSVGCLLAGLILLRLIHWG
jgi:hypothetical protein